MTLDDADVNALLAIGQLNSTVLHEMYHALGYGSLWAGVPAIPDMVWGAGGPNPFYLGAAGNKAYAAAGGLSTNGIPIENTGVVGDGTRDSHWRESALQTELLTGVLNSGANPLSAISIMSLADLGYAVNPAVADAYTLPVGAIRAGVQSAPSSLKDIVLRPKFVVDDAGHVTPVGPPPTDSSTVNRSSARKQQ
jgi:hypothetical protein